MRGHALILRLVSLALVMAGLCFTPARPASLHPAPRPLSQVLDADFRISTMGADGETRFLAISPAIAYNSAGDEYLVVWAGDANDAGALVDDELEIFGQRLDGAGDFVGARFRISTMGADGNANFDAADPALVYNDTLSEYFVVWQGDHTTDDEVEIYGQRLTAAGALAGSAIRISSMGVDGDPNFDALNPDVAFNATDGEYLVVWHGDMSADGALEIYGQRINAATGAETGGDFAISDMGTSASDAHYRAQDAAVAFNSTANAYLVVWSGDDDTVPLLDGEFEIFGQRLSAAGAELGSDFRISTMGPDGQADFDAYRPSVACNTTTGDYLVVWAGADNIANEFEIYGQRLTSAGAATGSDDFRISTMGPEENPAYTAFAPVVRYAPAVNETLVVWRGDDDANGLADNAYEIFGQWLDAGGAEVGDDDFRLSDAGNNAASDAFAADRPAVAINTGEMLAVWQARDDLAPTAADEVEVYGRRFSNPRYIPPSIGISPVSASATTPYAHHVHTLMITNLGTASETFNLSYAQSTTGALAWSVTPLPASVTIGAGLDATLTYTVVIPAAEVKWVTHTLTINVTAQSNGQSAAATRQTSTGGTWASTKWVGCRFDVTSDGNINMSDVVFVMSQTGLQYDYNHDGLVDSSDAMLVNSHMGNCTQ